jgi:hypothetical protein
MGQRDVLINLSATNQALRRELQDCKRQNTRMRAALLHTCEVCRVCACPKRERLFNEAFSRQLQTLKVPVESA